MVMLIPIYDCHKSRIREFMLSAISVYCFTRAFEIERTIISSLNVVDNDGVCHIGINIMVFNSCTKTILDPFLRFFSSSLFSVMYKTHVEILNFINKRNFHRHSTVREITQDGSKISNNLQLSFKRKQKKRTWIFTYFKRDLFKHNYSIKFSIVVSLHFSVREL